VKLWIDAGVPEEDIGVSARTRDQFDAVEAALRKAGVLSIHLGRSLPTGDGVRIGTMHRLKGVEFRCVAIMELDDDHLPLSYAVTDSYADAVQHEVDLRRERCLAYVAATRARDDLWIGWSGKPSRFLEPLVSRANDGRQ
jgi:superfamily I DNA/RNA helicase